jgi:hypothetical protein
MSSTLLSSCKLTLLSGYSTLEQAVVRPVATIHKCVHNSMDFFLWEGKTGCALIATPNVDNSNRRQKKGKS